MQSTLMAEGLSLLVVGMSTVLVFLAVLVLLTTFASALIARYFPDPLPAAAPAKPKFLASSSRVPVDPLTLQVISDAIQQHRSRAP